MKIQIDKVLHAAISTIIAIVFSTSAFLVLVLKFGLAALIAAISAFVAGFALSLTVGLIKELRDSRQPGNCFSWGDLAADALGSFVGAATVFIAAFIYTI